MNVSQLVETRQRRIDSLRDSISLSETRLSDEESVLDRLVELAAKPTYTIEEVNYLIDRSNDL
jgi:hypothetical protein